MDKIIKQAFTLIELLVVIAIIGILSGLIIIGMSGITTKANIAKTQVFSNSLRNALMMSRVSEWKFDELTTAVNGTIIQDFLGGSNNGTLSTGDAVEKLKTGGDCISGKCLSYDGTDDYIDCGSGSTLNFGTGDFSIETWVYYTGSTVIDNTKYFLSKSAGSNNPGFVMGYTTYSGNGSNLKFLSSITNGAWGTGNIESGAFFSPNTWQHIVLTRVGTTLKNYRNGSVDSQRTAAAIAANVDNALSLYIGRYNTYYFTGSMDDVRIYNAAVPTSQIKEHYFAGLNRLLSSGSISIGEYEERIQEISLNK